MVVFMNAFCCPWYQDAKTRKRLFHEYDEAWSLSRLSPRSPAVSRRMAFYLYSTSCSCLAKSVEGTQIYKIIWLCENRCTRLTSNVHVRGISSAPLTLEDSARVSLLAQRYVASLGARAEGLVKPM